LFKNSRRTPLFSILLFGGTHDNVVYAVQNGEVDAGTVRTDTLESMAAAGDISLDEFKIINRQDHSGFPFVASTSLYPEWPFAKLSSTPEEISNKVAQALLALPADSKAAQNAKIVGWYEPLDYSEIQGLQKKLLVGAYR
jgi:twitching motility protein PilJ